MAENAMLLEAAPEPRRSKLVDAIERRCNRAVTIDAHDDDVTLAKCNLQAQSPLFSVLPREIRDLIWAFATAPFEDKKREYMATEFYCRPGHRAPHVTDFTVLLTCRRVWLEANALPMLQAEHCFWYYREAPDRRNAEWMSQLTPLNRENFGHLHLFPQMYVIERLRDRTGSLRRFFLKRPAMVNAFQPRMFHVTVRHTDWWHWEMDMPLRFEDHWLQTMLNIDDLRSTDILKLELETIEHKVDQLMPIVERLRSLESKERETHIVDGKPVSTKFVLSDNVETYKWSGPAKINNEEYEPYAGKAKLNYHVVTLTWRLKFPSMPFANVAILRRAPRVKSADHANDPYIERDFAFSQRHPRPHLRRLASVRLYLRSHHLWQSNGTRDIGESISQARAQEDARREYFAVLMGNFYADIQQRTWASEKTLLKFAD